MMDFVTVEKGKIMAEYIEREAVYEKAYWHGEHPDVDNPFPDGVDAIDIKDVDAIPSVDVAPVRHGKWERDELGSYLRRCSVCKKTPIYKDERGNSAAIYAGICINCGARMDGDWNV